MAEKKLLQPAPLAPLVDGTAHDPTTQECPVTADNSVLARQASEDSAAKALMDKYGNAATAAAVAECGSASTPQTVDCLWNNGGGPVVDDWYEHLGECEREPVKAQVETALPWRKDMDRGNPCLNGNVRVLMAHSSPEFVHPINSYGRFHGSRDELLTVTINGETKEMTRADARLGALEHGSATIVAGDQSDQIRCGPEIPEGCGVNQWRPEHTALLVSGWAA